MRCVAPSPERASGLCAGLPIALAMAVALTPAATTATPTKLFRAPSPGVQPFAVPRLAYDTYFWPGSNEVASYPVTLGVTSGVLPLEKLRLEVGLDVIVPTRDPLSLNAKLGTPEGAMFAGSPAVAVGLYEIGVTSATALDVVYAVAGKRTQFGAFAVGGYVGTGRLLRSSSGAVHRAGVLAGVALPPIAVGRPWLQRVQVRWDVVTGRNVIGATGGGLAFVFLPSLSALIGPVVFFDPAQQPGGVSWLWSVQLTVDLGAVSGPDAPWPGM
ncbi:hypothetical protein [Anaeromyxobacter oryzisoli]|uniref:hypothetical protein n=1 Tax=Anaeromyxobacter oryzisoli TaxID=2925408 RepID=UPI001F583ED2|nr:hypothetical protein [Anaeromyxobacter sp. SG63]